MVDLCEISITADIEEGRRAFWLSHTGLRAYNTVYLMGVKKVAYDSSA